MRNKFNRVPDPNKFMSCSGSDIHVLYEGKIMSDGTVKLVPIGKESISEKINSYAAYTDIRYIMNRLRQGDTSVLRDGAFYGDMTKAPKSLADAMQIMINAENRFNELPLDVRNKFNNSYLQWMQTAGQDIWFENMGINKEVPEVIEKEEVINNES